MNDALRDLARRLRRLEEGVKAQNAPQLAHSSVEDGAIEHYDADGQLTAVVGRQHDDTVAPIILAGPTPPAPTGLDVVGGQLQVTATWDGTWADGAVAPMDFSRIEVHVGASQDFEPDPLPSSTTRVATIEAAGGASVTWQAEPGEVWVTIIARTLPGKASEHRELVSVEVTGAVDPEVFEQLKTDLAASAQAIADRIHDIETMPVDATRITDGTIYAPKFDTKSLGALVAQILRLDVSHLIAGDAEIGDAVIAKLTAQILAAHKITADDIDTGKIAAALADLIRIKAEQILTGTLNAAVGIGTQGSITAGDPAKIFARMDRDGFTTWLVTEDGTQILATALGSTLGEDALTIADATGRPVITGTSDGTMSMLDLDVDADPAFAGRPLLGKRLDPAADDGILDDAGRGPAGYGDISQIVTGTQTLATGYTPLAVVGFTMNAGRLYRVTFPYRLDISNVSGVGRAGAALFYTWKAVTTGEADEPSTTSSTFVGDSIEDYNANVGGVGGRMVFHWPSPFASPINIKLLVTVWSGNCQMTMSRYNPFDWKVLIEDVGPIPDDTARLLDVKTSGTTSSSGSTTTAPAAKRTYTATWAGAASKAYTGAGAQISGWTGSAKGLLQQGNPGDSGGNRRSLVVFTGVSLDGEKKTMDAALSGKTVTKAEVYLKFPHWWYSNGGEARIHPTNTSSILDTLPDSAISASSVARRFTARGQGAWIQIPTDWVKNGMRGLIVGPAAGAALTNYGYFCGPGYTVIDDRVKLRLTYT